MANPLEKIKMVNPIPKNDILKTLWIGTANIYEYQQVTDPITHQTTNKLVLIVQDEPCRLSYTTLQVTDVETGIASVTQVPKLFIRPNLTIKAGSKIEITQHGVTNTYIRTSEPAVYTNHQEIRLELDKEV